jgi:hypothetical protein
MVDADEADDEVEDVVRLRRPHKTISYHRSGDRSHRYSAEERACSMPRTPSKDTTIGTIVSPVGTTWRMGTHRQHAHMIGENLDIRRDVTGRMWNNTLRWDTQHPSRESTRISYLRGSDR